MKRYSLFLLVIGLFFLGSCDEIVDPIGGGGTGGGTGGGDKQDRTVIVEEFTGVACVQCPEGSLKIEQLLDINGDQLIAVSLHAAGVFSIPYPQNVFDFRTSQGFQLFDYLGPVDGYPSATVNRKVFNGESGKILEKEKWAGYITQELAEEAKVGVFITPNYDEGSRELEIDVELLAYETITDNTVLTVLITENNIEDHQITPTSSPDTQADYKHKHVFREVLSETTGDVITEDLIIGAEATLSYSKTLPDDWVVENCSIIAFVSLAGPNDLDVLQAAEVHVIE